MKQQKSGNQNARPNTANQNTNFKAGDQKTKPAPAAQGRNIMQARRTGGMINKNKGFRSRKEHTPAGNQQNVGNRKINKVRILIEWYFELRLLFAALIFFLTNFLQVREISNMIIYYICTPLTTYFYICITSLFFLKYDWHR